MGALSRFVERAGAAVVAAVLVGCATPEPVASVEERHARFTVVQSIPRGAWIEVNGAYQGTAPVSVETETSSSGWPRRVVVVRATDVSSGAFEEKRFYGEAMPERVLFDLRPWIRPVHGMTF